MKQRLNWMVAGLVACCLVSAGCSSGKTTPKAFIVTGTVNYQGKPVEGASVTFTPVTESPETRPANGKTDAEGKFTLKTYYDPQTELNGAIPGDYNITVSKKENGGVSQQEMMAMMQAGKPVPQPKEVLPAKYLMPQQSGLKRTVKQGEKNDFPLDLTD